ncbi:uncharacterized protein LOC144343503 [Saccoglossus kowalevskii]
MMEIRLNQHSGTPLLNGDNQQSTGSNTRIVISDHSDDAPNSDVTEARSARFARGYSSKVNNKTKLDFKEKQSAELNSLKTETYTLPNQERSPDLNTFIAGQSEEIFKFSRVLRETSLRRHHQDPPTTVADSPTNSKLGTFSKALVHLANLTAFKNILTTARSDDDKSESASSKSIETSASGVNRNISKYESVDDTRLQNTAQSEDRLSDLVSPSSDHSDSDKMDYIQKRFFTDLQKISNTNSAMNTSSVSKDSTPSLSPRSTSQISVGASAMRSPPPILNKARVGYYTQLSQEMMKQGASIPLSSPEKQRCFPIDKSESEYDMCHVNVKPSQTSPLPLITDTGTFKKDTPEWKPHKDDLHPRMSSTTSSPEGSYVKQHMLNSMLQDGAKAMEDSAKRLPKKRPLPPHMYHSLMEEVKTKEPRLHLDESAKSTTDLHWKEFQQLLGNSKSQQSVPDDDRRSNVTCNSSPPTTVTLSASQNPSIYQCTSCDVSFPHPHALHMHCIQQHVKKSLECPDCGRRYRLYCGLKRHQLTNCPMRHQTVKRYEQTHCAETEHHSNSQKMRHNCHNDDNSECIVCARNISNIKNIHDSDGSGYEGDSASSFSYFDHSEKTPARTESGGGCLRSLLNRDNSINDNTCQQSTPNHQFLECKTDTRKCQTDQKQIFKRTFDNFMDSIMKGGNACRNGKTLMTESPEIEKATERENSVVTAKPCPSVNYKEDVDVDTWNAENDAHNSVCPDELSQLEEVPAQISETNHCSTTKRNLQKSPHGMEALFLKNTNIQLLGEEEFNSDQIKEKRNPHHNEFTSAYVETTLEQFVATVVSKALTGELPKLGSVTALQNDAVIEQKWKAGERNIHTNVTKQQKNKQIGDRSEVSISEDSGRWIAENRDLPDVSFTPIIDATRTHAKSQETTEKHDGKFSSKPLWMAFMEKQIKYAYRELNFPVEDEIKKTEILIQDSTDGLVQQPMQTRDAQDGTLPKRHVTKEICELQCEPLDLSMGNTDHVG